MGRIIKTNVESYTHIILKVIKISFDEILYSNNNKAVTTYLIAPPHQSSFKLGAFPNSAKLSIASLLSNCTLKILHIILVVLCFKLYTNVHQKHAI